MEKEGLKRSLDLLDRHPQVQKYLREREMCHYYDVWHVVKGIKYIFCSTFEFVCLLAKIFVINYLVDTGPDKLLFVMYI